MRRCESECVESAESGGGADQALCALSFDGSSLHVLDQTLLPESIEYVVCRSAEDVAFAIRSMRVRGAPAIGAAAAYGMVLAALDQHRGGPKGSDASAVSALLHRLRESADHLIASRPTAVNLRWAVERVLRAARTASDEANHADRVVSAVVNEAETIAREDVETNRSLGRHGAQLLGEDVTILTHCNTGSLATVGYGTALGVIRAAAEMGKRVRVYADETRPFLQGSRLTALELAREGFDVTLIVDSAAAYLMRQGRIDAVIVGADRIAANGDVANKIGTYSLACLARQHGVPFYVAAPTSTIDVSLPSGDLIPIEERGADEVTTVAGRRVAPEGIRVYNPAFDVTPACLVSAIITEQGVLRPPYQRPIKAVCEASGAVALVAPVDSDRCS